MKEETGKKQFGVTMTILTLVERSHCVRIFMHLLKSPQVDISDSFLSLKAGGESHNYPVGKLSSAENCTLNISRVITFTIIQILSGSAVSS